MDQATTDAFRAAFQRELEEACVALARRAMGITQIDVIPTEDGGFMAYGHTSNADVTFVAPVPLAALRWRRHGPELPRRAVEGKNA